MRQAFFKSRYNYRILLKFSSFHRLSVKKNVFFFLKEYNIFKKISLLLR